MSGRKPDSQRPEGIAGGTSGPYPIPHVEGIGREGDAETTEPRQKEVTGHLRATPLQPLPDCAANDMPSL